MTLLGFVNMGVRWNGGRKD